MKLWLLMIGSLISITALSQTKNELTGNWKVDQVLIPAEYSRNNEANIKMVEKMFLQSKFQFNSNGTCKAEIPRREMQFKNTTWTYNEKEKAINISGDFEGNKGLLMKLLVSSKNSKWYFGIDESPILLEVQKVAGTN